MIYVLPLLIKMSLSFGISIPYHRQVSLIRMSEKYPIPDELLINFNRIDLETYLNGLWYSGQEMANDWTRGHEFLKSVGFVEVSRKEGHRTFTTMQYPNPNSHCR